MSWESLGGGQPHPYDTVIPTSAHTASNEEFVISEGYDVTLPTPVADGVVGVSAIGDVDVTTPSGTFENDSDHATINDSDSMYFVSDGSGWYVISPRDGLKFGRLNHIETQIANDDATIDFTNVFSSDYDRYKIYIDNYVPSDENATLDMRVSSDGGATWDSGASDYTYSRFYVSETGGTNANGGTRSEISELVFASGNIPSNNDTNTGSAIISDPIDGSRATAVRANSTRYLNSGTQSFLTTVNGGIRLAQSSVDSFQLLPNGGTISSGIISVYGVDQ